jgi:hypothetical protein
MPYVNKLDAQINDWNLTPVRKKMSIARYGDDFKGCHGKATLIPEIGVYSCTCGKFFEPTDGMQIRGTKLPLNTWAEAMALARKHGRNISAKITAENLGVSLVTAYRMLERINSLPEFDLGMGHKRPTRIDLRRAAAHRNAEVHSSVGEMMGLLSLSVELDGLKLDDLPNLSKDYRAGLEHGIKWASKLAHKRALQPHNPER